MKGAFCIKYIKFSTSRVTSRTFGATNNKIINELCRANWSVVTLARLRDLQIRQRWSEGAFSIIYVEISVHELCTVWRRSKLKNKIWHSGHNRHIALLKRTQKQVKMGYSVSIYKTLWNNSCSLHEILYTEPDELALLFYIFVIVMNDVKLFEPQRFWATNSTFPCDHQNQLDKPSLTYCVTWLCKLFSLSYDLFRRFYELEPKLVNVTN